MQQNCNIHLYLIVGIQKIFFFQIESERERERNKIIFVVVHQNIFFSYKKYPYQQFKMFSFFFEKVVITRPAEELSVRSKTPPFQESNCRQTNPKWINCSLAKRRMKKKTANHHGGIVFTFWSEVSISEAKAPLSPSPHLYTID